MFRGVASKLALVLLLLIAATVGATLLIIHDLWFYGILTAAVACLLFGGVFRLYRSNTRKITFMFNAIENNDYAFQFTRYGSSLSDDLFNRSLNRIKELLVKAKNEAIEREKYYELILERIITGIVVVNERGSVMQTNSEALRLLGLSVFTHLSQLDRVEEGLTEKFRALEVGEGTRVTLHHERGEVNLALQASEVTIRGTRLRIIAVNDSAIAGVKMSTEDIMKRLRGPKGSKVNLTIVRRGVQGPLLFTVKRDKIPILSLDASYMIQPKTGYIRINRFGATTAEEFKKAMTSLQKQGMKDMILDLQGNGGGYLNAAIDLANEFLGQKELIVYTEGRTAKRSDFYAKGNGDFRNGRLIILVDEYTASASEIVSGAVQDWDRGIIVGRRSFGKGLVQRPIDLPDGSMIRLTIARYYTPSGRSIQKPYGSTVDYNKDLIDRFNHGELMNADSIHFPDSLKVQTKKLGRTVYGGGGIMPDYFVPIDTTLYTDYHRNLVGKGVIIKFTMQFIEGHRKELANKYKKFESFNEKFVIDDNMLATLREMGEKEGVKFNEEQYQKALPLIKTQLKALIARDLWDMTEYFRVMNTTNESVQKALEILNSDEYGKKLK